MTTPATTVSRRPPPVAGDGARALAEALAHEEKKLLACVHCGFCLSACPTYTRLGDEADSPRGRLYLMRAVVEGRLEPGADAFATHIDRCLGCRACETVCPSGVEYGFLLERARAVIAERRGSLAARALLGVFGSRWLTRLMLRGARLLRAGGSARALVRLVPARFGRVRFGLAMLAASAPVRLPRSSRAEARRSRSGAEGSSVNFRGAEVQARSLDSGAPGGAPSLGMTERRRVALLTGCVQEGLFAHVNRATERVLVANGCELVAAAGQGCCGALHAHGGELEGARALARANIDAFERAGAGTIVVNAAGCGAAMKGYGELLADDPGYAARARAHAARVRDLFELLAELGPTPAGALPLRVTYDAPCHLHHAQRVTAAPLEALRRIPGIELVPLPDAEECCGGAGIYGLLHPDLAGRILADKVSAIGSTGADVVVTPNPGCIMQIGAGLLLAGDRTPVLHPIELVDESYRRAASETTASP